MAYIVASALIIALAVLSATPLNFGTRFVRRPVSRQEHFSDYIKGLYYTPRNMMFRQTQPIIDDFVLDDPGELMQICDYQEDYNTVFIYSRLEWCASNAPQRRCRYLTNFDIDAGFGSVRISEKDGSYYLTTGKPFLWQVDMIASRPVNDGCHIMDVIVYVQHIDHEFDPCYLAVFNGILSLSCPPEHLPMEYRILTVFPVVDKRLNNPNYGHWSICATRGGETCEQFAKIVDNTGNLVSTGRIYHDY